ncbi:phenylalanine--tRNA ligase subunit alpha [Mesomycoplasma conjunctivae]|uniref:phenylalanine--tRNA ligase subunit alpha n=1 Tax=Mesomycoplasma conjunctivae TaxID=45361 RepID=UPI003DA40FD3
MDVKQFFANLVINNLEDLKLAKNSFFGKNSYLAELQNKIKSANQEEKKQLGKQISQLKEEANSFFSNALKQLEQKEQDLKIANQWLDISSFKNTTFGQLHPLTLISNSIRNWFVANGYYEAKASEIVSDEYNFTRLNIPKNHPAREMHDSLYINANLLLRTHNTGVSALELEKNKNLAFGQFTIGKVYRNDEEDSTHSHQFQQLDFVAVDNCLSIANLMATIKALLNYVFEQDVQTRFRPSFFPFTEPSLEVDIFYNNRWIEILGCGMLHPQVLTLAGYDNKMRGFAGGIGIERLAMIKYNISDIRELYKNDLRFLKQFR